MSNKINIALFDFDGVFTNCKACFIPNGNDVEICKQYYIRDTYGIRQLQENKIKVILLSGYVNNKSQETIATHLNFDEVHLGIKDKWYFLQLYLKENHVNSLNEIAFVGDDINDFELMSKLNFTGSPKDSIDCIRHISKIKLNKCGGEGCVREFCEIIIENNRRMSEKTIQCILLKNNYCSQNNLFESKFATCKSLKSIYIQKLMILQNIVTDLQFFEENEICLDSTTIQFCLSCNYPFLDDNQLIKAYNEYLNNPHVDIIVITINPMVIDIIYSEKEYNLLQKTAIIMVGKMNHLQTKGKLLVKNLILDDLNEINTFTIDSNMKYLMAESLYLRHFQNTQQIENFMTHEIRNKKVGSRTTILDCTIRDSGYLNNWQFNKSFVLEYIKQLSMIGNIEYCEIGFFKQAVAVENNAGIYRNLSEHLEIFKEIKNYVQNQIKLAVMMDIEGIHDNYFDVNFLPDQQETGIDLIRVFSFYEILPKSIEVIKKLKAKGYTISLNIGHCGQLTKDELQVIKELLHEIGDLLDYFYFADSHGLLTANSIVSFLVNFKNIHQIKNGFHNHNNNGTIMGSVNSLLNANIDLIDATLSGFGKNGGNCNLEQLLCYLYFECQYENIDIYQLMDFIEFIDSQVINNMKFDKESFKEMLIRFVKIHPSHVSLESMNLKELLHQMIECNIKRKVWS